MVRADERRLYGGKEKFAVGTFNVRDLMSAVKRNSLCRDLSFYGIDVCTLQKTKLPAGLDEQRNG